MGPRLGNSARGGAGKGFVLLALLVAVIAVGVGVWLRTGPGILVFLPGGTQDLTLEAAREMANPVPDSPEVRAEAKALFTEQCANCHGDQGDGQGPEAQMYDPSPADFTNARRMQNMRDGELFYRITEGRKPMPSFQKTLTEQQRWKLVRYVRTFASKPVEQKQD